jgi:hypothetical protein
MENEKKIKWEKFIDELKETKKSSVIYWHEIDLEDLEKHIDYYITSNYFVNNKLVQTLRKELKNNNIYGDEYMLEKFKKIIITNTKAITIKNILPNNFPEFMRIVGEFFHAAFNLRQFIKENGEKPFLIETNFKDKNLYFTFYFSNNDQRKEALQLMKKYIEVFN